MSIILSPLFSQKYKWNPKIIYFKPYLLLFIIIYFSDYLGPQWSPPLLNNEKEYNDLLEGQGKFLNLGFAAI